MLPGPAEQHPVAVVQRAHGGHQHDRGSRACAGRRPGRAWSAPRWASSRGPGQHVEQALRVRGGEDAGRQRPVGGQPGQRDVGAQRLRARRWPARARARPRCPRRRGPPGRSAPRRRAAARCPGRRTAAAPSIRAGSLTPAARSTSADWATSATRWLAALASPAWYSGRLRLVDEDRLAAHLDDQRLGRGLQRFRRGHPEADPGQPVEVVRAPGERHDRVQRQRQRAAHGGGLQHGGAVPAAGVRQQPPGQRRVGRGQPGHQAGQHVVGHGEQDQVDGGQQLRRRA